MSKREKGDCPGGENCMEEAHLCKIARRGDMETIRNVVKDARYFCRKCGRSARSAVNLCKAVAL